MVGLIGIAVMLLFIGFGVPVSFSMGFTGVAGFAFLWGTGKAINLAGIIAYNKTDSYILACIPLFILMGQTVFHCGIARDLFTALHKWLSRLAGGLAMTTTASCACFASVCGSSPVTAATMGAMALPEMKRYEYSPSLATGCVSAAGTLGILIPPSIPMVVYGIMTEQSIGRLFIAGIIPGVLSAFLYMVMIYIRAKLDPKLAPHGSSFTLKEKLNATKKTWGVALLFFTVIGGIYLGIFTPTEASAVGAFLSLSLGFIQGQLTQKSISASLEDTARITAMILAIIIGAMVFCTFIVTTGLPDAVTGFVVSLEVNRYVILVVMLLIYLVLGCFMDVLGILVLTVPLFFPIVLKLNFDPIWFGIVLTKMVEVSLITPPIGVNCLVIKGVSGDYASLQDIFKGIAWFFVVDLITITIIVLLPWISLFLPNLMYK
ncbi:MAG: TRAP transporter large permease [Deltaproteobacteria bacterium]|nr:MAG: TRAP transporter large permease [Deltaproteobacteria bacterium]